WVAYGVASVSGSILAVCSCTILPLFSGIYKRGAGIGPATTFLYAGPAINILAIVLTARVLGLEMGIARVVGAVVFSIVIGLVMQLIYRKEDRSRAEAQMILPESDETRPLWQTGLHFFVLVAILVFANWGRPAQATGLFHFLYSSKWIITALFGVLLGVTLHIVLQIKMQWIILTGVPVVGMSLLFPDAPLVPFTTAVAAVVVLISCSPGEPQEWMASTWGFAKQILPLLGAGVLIAGLLLGSPEGGEGLIPGQWVASLVGGNSVLSTFFAAIVGAFMYFATLTEVPILQGLMAAGMGKGPALALLLAGPALSLPNMLVIRSVIGTKKTIIFIALVVVMATITGLLFGMIMT
ncbi:permease, partial [bacterium]